MNIKNRLISLIYRIFALTLSGYALLKDIGIFEGKFRTYNLFYFTIISNIFCLGLFLALTIITIHDIKAKGIHGTSSIKASIKGEITISIILTMSVYHFILIPYALKQNPKQILKFTDIVFHYIIPILTIFDWILFDEKRRFKWYYPILWTIGPITYLLLIFTQAHFNILKSLNKGMSNYVYIFLDIGKIGIPKVIESITLLSISFIIIGYFIYGLDKIKIE